VIAGDILFRENTEIPLYHECGIIISSLVNLSQVWCGVTSEKLRWIVAGILILLVLVLPVSAGTRTVINHNATVFIGEQGLDISPAMGSYNSIAWWPSAATPGISSPSRVIDVSASKTGFFVPPATFVGYTGIWYLWDGTNPLNPPAAFWVDDPAMGLTIFSLYGPDVTGKSVVGGTPLGFQVPTNLYQSGGEGLLGGSRGSAPGDTDTNLKFRVRTPSGAEFTTLLNTSGAAVPLGGQFVDGLPFYWTADGIVSAEWNTGASVGGLPVYEPGTYTVWAESTLNGMIDNYKDAGVDYVGKTRSPAYTVTILRSPISISAAGDQSYYLGEDIKFSVNITPGPAKNAYMFMIGPGLPGQGARLNLNPAASPVANGSGASFTNPTIVLDTFDFTLSQYSWHTIEDSLVGPGTYTIYAAAGPFDRYNVSATHYNTVSIVLKKPFITASVSPSTGPIGTVFHFAGVKEGGASPGYYAYILMTNNTPPLTGSLPANGVRPDDLLNQSVTGRNESFVQAWVQADRSWSYDWDSSKIARGSLLRGSQYQFYVEMRPMNVADAKVDGRYSKLQVGIEGAVHADFSVDAWNGTTVEFRDVSTGMPSSASYDFGDGLTRGVTPGSKTMHTYLSPGTYTVRLTVSNSQGSDSTTREVTVVSTTRDRSYNDVYTSPILNSDITGKAIYTSQNPLKAGTPVNGWATSFNVPVNGWLIFIDDHPKANWEHPVRLVISDDTHQQTVFQGTSYPKNIGLSQIAGETLKTRGGNEIGDGYSAGYTGGGGGNAVCGNIECKNCYALLISGGFDKDNNFDRYWNDLSGMYKTLRETYCYPEENIYVLMSDGGDPGQDQRTGPGSQDYDSSPTNLDDLGRVNDIYGKATRADVENMLHTLSGDSLAPAPGVPTLTSDDDLFIFTTNHGGQDPAGTGKVRLWLWGEEEQQYIWDDEFVNGLGACKARSITMTMEQCYSGGFVDPFIKGTPPGQTRVIATAASAAQPSYGNDFSFWWIDGAMGPANDPTKNDGIRADAFTSFLDVFMYAASHDPSAVQHYETPVYSGGTPDAGDTSGLSSCSHCPPVQPVLDGILPLDISPPDGLYEDLDANGLTRADAAIFFSNLESMKGKEPVCRFDLNGNGRLDFADIVKLYQGAP
jgi:PKD repeat protein